MNNDDNQILARLWQTARTEESKLLTLESAGHDLYLGPHRLADPQQLRLWRRAPRDTDRFLSRLPLSPKVLTEVQSLLRSRPEAPTIGDYARAFLESPGNYMGVEVHHVRQLVRLVAEACVGRILSARTLRQAPFMALVLALPAGIMDSELVERFLRRRFEAAGAREAEKNTANTILSAARSPFRDLRGLPPPVGLSGFLGERPLSVTRRRKQALPIETMIALFAAIHAEETKDPLCHVVIILALYGGLRKQEIVKARWCWLGDAPGTYATITVRRGKLNKDRVARIDLWLLRFLEHLKKNVLVGNPNFILGEDPRMRNAACERAVALLRANGLARMGRPVAFLRSASLTQEAAERGAEASRDKGGHGGMNMGWDFYLECGYTDAHRDLARRGPGDLALRFAVVDFDI